MVPNHTTEIDSLYPKIIGIRIYVLDYYTLDNVSQVYSCT